MKRRIRNLHASPSIYVPVHMVPNNRLRIPLLLRKRCFFFPRKIAVGYNRLNFAATKSVALVEPGTVRSPKRSNNFFFPKKSIFLFYCLHTYALHAYIILYITLILCHTVRKVYCLQYALLLIRYFKLDI